jgi:hypothetical protein
MANLGDLLDKKYENMEFAELADAPVEALQGLSAGDAAALKQAFNIKTIGDLGRNKFVVTAVAVAALAGKK